MTVTPIGLSRKSLGGPGLWFLAVAASAPMTVLAGGIVTTLATTGVVGVPVAFLVLAGALTLFAVGFLALSKEIAHAATFYAFIARGLGRVWAVSGAALSLLAYNAIQISLYGLFGATVGQLFGGPWWAWALAIWAVVGLLGVLHIDLNARVVALVVSAQIAMIVLFDIAAFKTPAPGRLVAPLLPSSLLTSGIGGVLALSIAAFVGFESILVYREEAKAFSGLRRATFVVVLFLGVFYAVSAWALVHAVGPDLTAVTPDFPFTLLATEYGAFVAVLGQGVLILSIFAAMTSFHNVVARYVFALAREGVLTARLDRIGGTTGGVPIAGSLLQSVIAASTIAAFAIFDADPVAAMFTILSTLAALGVLLLMIGACAAAVGYFWGRPGKPWTTRGAPVLGGLALLVIFGVTVFNIDSLAPGTTFLQWLLPLITVLVLVLGAVWARYLRVRRPGVYATIGQGQPRPLAVLDRVLAHLEL